MAFIQKRKGHPKPFVVHFKDENGKRRCKSFTQAGPAKIFEAKAEQIEQTANAGAIDLETAAVLFIRDKQSSAPRTPQSYLSIISNFVKFIGASPLHHVTQAHVQAWKDHRATEIKPNTLRNNLKALRAFFNWCLRKNPPWIQQSPAAGVDIPRFKRNRAGWLDEKTANKLLDELKDENKEFWLMGLLALRAGLRQDEIITLKWEQVRFDTRRLEITGKSKEPRKVPMSQEIIKALMDWGNAGEYVFPARYRGTNAHTSVYLSKHFNRWLRSHGYSITLHGLRHSFASHLASRGVSAFALKELMGHVSLTTTELYVHSASSAAEAIVNMLGDPDPQPSASGHQPSKPRARKAP